MQPPNRPVIQETKSIKGVERQQMKWKEEGNRESADGLEADTTWWPQPTDALLDFEDVCIHVLMNIFV